MLLDADQLAALLQEQERLESLSYEEGRALYMERVRRAISKGRGTSGRTAARKLMREALPGMLDALSDFLDRAEKQRGSKHTAVKWIQKAGIESCAYLALRVCLDTMIQTPSFATVARQLSGMLLDELRYRRFKVEQPGLFRYRMKRFTTTSYTHIAKSLNAALAYNEVDVTDLTMTATERLLVGSKLLDIVLTVTGLATLELEYDADALGKRGGHRKRKLKLVPTAETLEWMDGYHTQLSMHQPMVLPMVVPPAQWSDEQPGGYRFAMRGRFDLVRSWPGAQISSKLSRKPAERELVFSALNSMQETGWKVNRQVFDVLAALLKRGGGVAGLPVFDDDALPNRPRDIDTNEESRLNWRREAHRIHERNKAQRVKRNVVFKTLAVAQQMVEYDAIFFPHSLDFRGRVYPIAQYLSPQGDDAARGLLLFAQGKAMDSEAATRWLALHGANAMGATPEGQKVSSMTLGERVEWVVKNSKHIIGVAGDPLGNTWWQDADDPFQFLAFCFEWTAMLQAEEDGEDYVCALPCAMDGSCNGLQHFSALLKDAESAKLVNIVPQDRPRDIYSVIGQRVLEMTQEDAAAGNEHAMFWLAQHAARGLIARDMVKRPTMTVVYGAKRYGFEQQMKAYIQGREDFIELRGETEDLGAYYRDMGDRIWRALEEATGPAFATMEWMQNAVKGISNQHRSVSWRVPITGFQVAQGYYQSNESQIATTVAGKTYWPSIYTSTTKVDSKRASNAIAPNFIHSLDAAALMLTVVRAKKRGVHSFAMIHDSYGATPTDCAVVAKACRDAFVQLYTEADPLSELYRDLKRQWETPTECPKPPSRHAATLDVRDVRRSLYFFA